MKITIIALALIAMGLKVQAQTEKSTKTVGLNLSYQHYNESFAQNINPSSAASQSKYTGITVGPSFSYFIGNGLDIGGNVTYYHTDNNNSDNVNAYYQQQSTKGGSATIYVRKYYMFQNKIGIRTGPYIGYGEGSQLNKYTQGLGITMTEPHTTSYNAGANFDIVYYPLKNLGITATMANVGYSHQKVTSDNGKAEQDNFNLGFITNGLGISLIYAICTK